MYKKITLMSLFLMLFLLSCTGKYNSTEAIFEKDIYINNGYELENSRISEVVEKLRSQLDKTSKYSEISVLHPFDGAVVPKDISSISFMWEDDSPENNSWLVTIEFPESNGAVNVLCNDTTWIPDKTTWEYFKANSTQKPAQITISGFTKDCTVTSSSHLSLSTSNDAVDAPVFYQQIPLPFNYAFHNPQLSRWVVGDVSSYEQPDIVMDGLPLCANCHTFSQNGRYFGMDMDIDGDKGGYAFLPVSHSMELKKEDFISWNDLPGLEGVPNMGLFTKISSDGGYVVSTIQERPFMAVFDDPDLTQLFFPITGLLAYYSAEENKFHTLPGADDPKYVQTSPCFSPDTKHVVFSRAEVRQELLDKMAGNRVLKLEPGVYFEDLNQEYQIQYDLYRVAFNNGQGGTAEPLAGAFDNGKSNYFPRFSPDGEWIVYCQSETGLVMQPTSELYIVPAKGGTSRRMNCNTEFVNSWHSFSPNGRWLVFVSKVYSPYTELFITHIDKDGNDSPPVLLHRFSSDEHAAIIPEFVDVRPGDIERINFKVELNN